MGDRDADVAALAGVDGVMEDSEEKIIDDPSLNFQPEVADLALKVDTGVAAVPVVEASNGDLGSEEDAASRPLQSKADAFPADEAENTSEPPKNLYSGQVRSTMSQLFDPANLVLLTGSSKGPAGPVR